MSTYLLRFDTLRASVVKHLCQLKFHKALGKPPLRKDSRTTCASKISSDCHPLPLSAHSLEQYHKTSLYFSINYSHGYNSPFFLAINPNPPHTSRQWPASTHKKFQSTRWNLTSSCCPPQKKFHCNLSSLLVTKEGMVMEICSMLGDSISWTSKVSKLNIFFICCQVLYQLCSAKGLWAPRNTMASFSFVLLMNPIIFSIFIWGSRSKTFLLVIVLADNWCFGIHPFPCGGMVFFFFFSCYVCVCALSQVDASLYKHVIVYLPKSCSISLFFLKNFCFAY